jgi:hypothetical protein
MATTAQQPIFDLWLLLLLGAVSGALSGTAECGWMRLFIDSACGAATLVTTAPLATSWRFPRGAEYSLRHGTGAEQPPPDENGTAALTSDFPRILSGRPLACFLKHDSGHESTSSSLSRVPAPVTAGPRAALRHDASTTFALGPSMRC